MLRFALLALLAVPAIAGADTPRPPPPPHAPIACTSSGNVVLAILHKSESTARYDATMKVFAGGGWTAERTVAGKTARASGCLGVATVARLGKVLTTAPWTVRAVDARTCTITIGYNEEYWVDGKHVYTVWGCGGGDPLDAVSVRALAELHTTLGSWWTAFDPPAKPAP